MAKFKCEVRDKTLWIGFGDEAAQTPQIGVEAETKIAELKESGQLSVAKFGKLLKINGPGALVVGFGLAHDLGHVFGAIAVFDPKIDRYVIVISHDPDYPRWSTVD